MSWQGFWILFAGVAITMLLCRVVPAFVLKGKDLSESTKQLLNLIPAAAFAALVANDLISADMFADGIWAGFLPIVATFVVFYVAKKTSSLIICCLAGIGIYAILYLFL